MSKHRALVFIQWSVSLGLIWCVLSKVDLAGALSAARNVDFILLLLGAAQLAIQPLIGTLRWRLIIQALGGDLRFGAALRFVWIGTFFSQALPGMVGGDAVRIWLYLRHGVSRRLAINSVALERVAMLLSLLILVAAAQLGLHGRTESVVASWLPPLALAAALGGLIILMLSDRLVRRFSHRLSFRAVGYLASDSRKALLQPITLIGVTLTSVLAYLNMTITVWVLALALGLAISLVDCLALVPLALLAAMIPVSAGGWGVREGAMIVLFGTAGVSSADALALSILFGLSGILVSLPGVAIWLGGGYRRSDLSEAAILAGADTPKN
jgi:glycosyltransferase 2 family protein